MKIFDTDIHLDINKSTFHLQIENLIVFHIIQTTYNFTNTTIKDSVYGLATSKNSRI